MYCLNDLIMALIMFRRQRLPFVPDYWWFVLWKWEHEAVMLEGHGCMTHVVGHEQTDRAASLEACAELFFLVLYWTERKLMSWNFEWRVRIDVLREGNPRNVIFKPGAIVIYCDVLVVMLTMRTTVPHHNPGNTTCNKFITCNNFFWVTYTLHSKVYMKHILIQCTVQTVCVQILLHVP